MFVPLGKPIGDSNATRLVAGIVAQQADVPRGAGKQPFPQDLNNRLVNECGTSDPCEGRRALWQFRARLRNPKSELPQVVGLLLGNAVVLIMAEDDNRISLTLKVSRPMRLRPIEANCNAFAYGGNVQVRDDNITSLELSNSEYEGLAHIIRITVLL